MSAPRSSPTDDDVVGGQTPSRSDGHDDLVAPTQRLAERLGPYRLIQRIGEGGMGIVHFALDPHGRAVAIKVLRPHVSYDDEARARLQREVDSLSRISHPRVAPVIDADIHGPRPYLVTRFIDGDPLDDAVSAHGPLRGESLLQLARGLVGALEAIHAEGIVHRDLKPGNVLVCSDGEPVLIDFGIAHLDDDVRLTSTGLVMGTPGYLAPEVIEGQPVTVATDWWGWAATLAYAATGRPPFGRGGMDVVLTRVRAGECDLTGIDPGLEPLLAAALSPRPHERPSAATVLAALEQYAAGGSAASFLPEGARPTREVSVRHTQVLPASEPEAAYGLPSAGQPYAPSGPAQPEWRYAVPAAWDQPAVAPGPGGGAWPTPGAPPWGAPDGGTYPAGPAGPAAPAAPADPRIGRPDRSGTLATIVVFLAAVAAVAPVVAVLVGLAWTWIARSVDRAVTSLVVRRYERGPRRSDMPVAVAMTPVHIVAAALAAAVAAVLPVAIGVATVVSVALLWAAVFGGPPTPGGAVGFAVGAAAAAVTAWWGPGGAGLRRGSRSIVRSVARPGLLGDIVVGVMVAGAIGLGVWAAVRGGMPLWWPLAGAPGLFGGW